MMNKGNVKQAANRRGKSSPPRFVAAIYCITGSMDSCSKTHLEGLLFDPEELSCDDDDDALLNLLSRLWNGERSRRVLLANG